MAELISGKIVSDHIREQIKTEVKQFVNKNGVAPGLAVILVGDNAASRVYVRNKHKACLDVGIESYQIELPEDTSEQTLLAKIDELNNDARVNGILVQLPLPSHINEKKVILAINPQKDVDAFHPFNVGGIMTGDHLFLPCTPAGVISMLDYYNISISGKRCVVVGRSNIVGKPMSMLLLERNGTVTIAHSKTENLSSITRDADILVVAVGRPGFITGDMVREGAVVIDVGINRSEDGKLCGDVDFASVEPRASYITPVPGGVGPMTITTLLQNTIKAAYLQTK